MHQHDTPGWAWQLLESAAVGRLGTTDPDGQPLVVPICFAADRDRIYSAIDAKPKRSERLRRLVNIAANPKASLLIDDYHADWRRLRYVIAEGAAAVTNLPAERRRAVDLLLAKYSQYRELGLDRQRTTVIVIAVERLLCWRASADGDELGSPSDTTRRG